MGLHRYARPFLLLVFAASAASCASTPRSSLGDCSIIVQNRTPSALEVRMHTGPFATIPLGALNPGELLTHGVPCSLGRVWLVGIGIPMQVGGPAVRYVRDWADLVEGERVRVSLWWPWASTREHVIGQLPDSS